MFIQYWQIEAAMQAAKAQDPQTLVGSRVNYNFLCDMPNKKNGCTSGLFGWIVEHKNPDAPATEPMELTIAFDTTIDEFYVSQEGLKARFAREQLAGDSTSINEFDNADEIDDNVFGKLS
jgi:aspartate aminotransferase-like enzyme